MLAKTGAKKAITRTKTGCLTCRRRRKKCDEHKPECHNCLRNKLVCEGYQRSREWHPVYSHLSPRAQPRGTSQPKDSDADIARPTADLTSTCSLFATKEPRIDSEIRAIYSFSSPLLAAQPGLFSSVEELTSFSDINFGDDSDINDDDLGLGSDADLHQVNSPGADDLSLEQADTDNCTPDVVRTVSDSEQRGSLVLRRRLGVCLQLPSLIDGIKTQSERKIFHHYHKVLTPALLLETSQNPLVTALLPRALAPTANSALLDAIMCTSASNYQRLAIMAGTATDLTETRRMESLKWERHGRAVKQHIQMLSQLSSGPLASFDEAQQLLTLTMILYQFSLLEGGQQALWRIHLRACCELVRRLYQDDSYDRERLDPFESFVLRWFSFAEVCYSLTSLQYSPCINLSMTCSSFRSLQTDTFLIDETLLSLLSRTIKLHRDSRSTREEDFDMDLLSEALEIEAGLQDWHYDYTDPSSSNVAECYRLATFILLWFTMYPQSPIAAEKVQLAVREGLSLVEHISGTDKAQTCSLLPLFIFGVSTDVPESRALILDKIETYAKYAGIANIAEAGTFLKDWCRASDSLDVSSRRWWDWESYLQANEVNIILV